MEGKYSENETEAGTQEGNSGEKSGRRRRKISERSQTVRIV